MVDSEIQQNSLSDFELRFSRLTEEAKSYGMSSAFVIVETDPLSRTDCMSCGHDGAFYAVVGALETFVTGLKEEMTKARQRRGQE
jgi:hypothetical protein